MDGLSKTEQIANRCSKIEARACALTDHGNIAGAVKFYADMLKNNIKPILGCELYICDQNPSVQETSNRKLSHFIVLAKNYKGWKNLIRIVSESNRPDYFYHRPRLDINTLKEIVDPHNMLAVVGHLGSTLASSIIDENDTIKKDYMNIGSSFISSIKDIFGNDNVFLEAQLMDKENIPLQISLTGAIRDLGKETNTKVICTPDAHYAEKDDAMDQRILLCNNLKTTLNKINSKIQNHESIGMGCFFLSDNYHIPSQEEISDLHTDEEIDNTNIVADMCEHYDILDKPHLPSFDCPKDYNSDEYLRQLCRDGWREKIQNNIPKEDQEAYAQRIKSELEVLQGAGLSSYFLIVQDIVKHVKDQGWLPGPGRGCFIPETRVKMASGELTPIFQIEIGDSVIDAFGNIQKVYDTMKYEIDEDILELELDNGKIIRCTKDHKFLTKNRGWVEAQFLEETDDMETV